MTDKELQKLKRPELLEIMLGLQNELDKEREENEVLRAKLEEKQIALNKSGSIAEAALEINGVFDAAQKAADVYLENVKKMHAEEEKHHVEVIAQANSEAEAIIADVRREAETLRAKTDIECRTKLKNTEEECNIKIQNTENECTRKINETNTLCTKKIKETQDKCTAIASLNSQIATFFSSDANNNNNNNTQPIQAAESEQ